MALKDKMSVGRKGEVVMANATGGQEIPTPEDNLIDASSLKDTVLLSIPVNDPAVANQFPLTPNSGGSPIQKLAYIEPV